MYVFLHSNYLQSKYVGGFRDLQLIVMLLGFVIRFLSEKVKEKAIVY